MNGEINGLSTKEGAADVTKGTAFEEYIKKKYEETITNDEYYINLNCKILKLEQELLPLLSNDALDKFFKIDELSMELTNYIGKIFTDNFTIFR